MYVYNACVYIYIYVHTQSYVIKHNIYIYICVWLHHHLCVSPHYVIYHWSTKRVIAGARAIFGAEYDVEVNIS